MKNRKILLKHGIDFKPLASFPFIADTVFCRSLIKQYLSMSPIDMINKLAKSKNADHVLSLDEERSRDELTYALFCRLAQFSSKHVDSEKLRAGDKETKKNLEYNLKHKPVTGGSYGFIYSKLPTRFQRAFIQLSILCGWRPESAKMDHQGFELEITACKKLWAA